MQQEKDELSKKLEASSSVTESLKSEVTQIYSLTEQLQARIKECNEALAKKIEENEGLRGELEVALNAQTVVRYSNIVII